MERPSLSSMNYTRLLRAVLGRSPRIPLIATITFACLTTIAPGRVARAQSASLAEECNQLVDVVDQSKAAVAEFDAEVGRFAQNASQAETLDDIKQVAQQYVDAVDGVIGALEGMASTLDSLEIADEQLTSYRDRYETVVSGLGEALTLLSTAMTGLAEVESVEELPQQLETLQSETAVSVEQVQELSMEEATLVTELNAHCGIEETGV